MHRFSSPASFYSMSVYKQFYTSFIFIFALLIPSFIPQHYVVAADNLPIGQCVVNYDANTDYFPTKVTVEFAQFFSIQYFNNYKLLTNTQSKETFALYQCGTPAPTTLPTGTKVFSIAANKIAALDTSSVSFLEVLGLRSNIVALDSSEMVSSPCIQSLKEKGSITELSDDEALHEQQLEVVDVAFGSLESKPNSLKSVSTYPTSDPGTLNRVEWLKFYSVFFNLEKKSNDIVTQISDNYNCYKKMAADHSLKEKPLVAWISYVAPDSFNNNTPTWNIADAIYKKQLTEDAGGVYFNATTLVYSDTTSFLQAIANVDIVIDETFIGSTIADFFKNYNLSADQTTYKFIKNKAVYREDGIINPIDGRDWFEDAIVMGDAVLEDMINVVNPSLPSTSYKRNWFRNVANDEPIKVSSSANCTDVQANSIVSKADVCSTITVKSDNLMRG
nr:2582_t:CDS:2 [Entrophospora candida]